MLTFTKFLIVGATATSIQYGFLIALVESTGLDPKIASTIGYLISAVCNYLLNRSFTFQSDEAHKAAAPKFVAVAGIGLLINFTVMWAGAYLLKNYLLSQLAATIIVLFWGFLMNKFWTFGSR